MSEEILPASTGSFLMNRAIMSSTSPPRENMLVKMSYWDKYKLCCCQLKMFSVCQNPPASPVSIGLWQLPLNPTVPFSDRRQNSLMPVPCVWQGKQCQGKQTREHVWGLAKQLGARTERSKEKNVTGGRKAPPVGFSQACSQGWIQGTCNPSVA